MDASTRRRALRAAAKLAVGVTFGACGGEIAAMSADAGDARKYGGRADGSSAVAEASTASLCSLNDTTDAGTLTSEAVDCCLALTTAATPADAGWSFDAGAFKSDPSLLGCCQALHDKSGQSLVGLVYGPKKWQTNTCQACADAIGQPSACTPWGPPVPPAMLEVA